ncbi:toll-like receptor 8 isoform X1 [Engraulis encrasicolus]|uniref:toll-like receptor 8 isoform X1 n=2 Tax=Engraulis encrasicolus TaxID=184585 RepID=UPI002FD508CC
MASFWLTGTWFFFSLGMTSTLGAIVVKDLRKVPCEVEKNDTAKTITFDCSRRGLRKIPDGIWKNVTSLILADNKIGNVSAVNFTASDEKKTVFYNLTYLKLDRINKYEKLNLSTGAFSNLTKLNVLRISGVGLHEVPKHLPASLIRIYLDGNNITHLNQSSFSGMSKVMKISLSKNCFSGNPCNRTFRVENNTFSNLTNLQSLILSYNNITAVPHGLPDSLTVLDLASNRIEFIFKDDFVNLVNLVTLRIQGNCPRCRNAPYPCVPCKRGSITIHPQAFRTLSKLNVLQLAGNSLLTLSDSWFENLRNLTNLFLSFNFLARTIAEGSFLVNLTSLQRLDLSYNFDLHSYPKTMNLSKHFSKLASLHTLHIEGYVFQEIKDKTFEPLQNLANLSVLNLGVNFIVLSESKAFTSLPKLKLLYLAENRLHPISEANPIPSNGAMSSNVFVPREYVREEDYNFELSHGYIKTECYKTGRVLDLSRNNLFFLSSKQFERFGDVLCLNLSRNGFSAALNGTEFTYLPNLTYLDLSYNKVDLAYEFAFSELKHLEVLDLSYNNHYFLVAGVTKSFTFLENLSTLRVLNLSGNAIFSLTTKELNSSSLNELQFNRNRLNLMWKGNDNTYYKLFKNLLNLTHLDLSYNDIVKIPHEVFENLPPNITRLYINHNSLNNFRWSDLRYLQHLQNLDLSHNGLTSVSSNLSKYIPAMTVLDLSFNKISTLSDGFVNGAKSLQELSLMKNKISILSGKTFPSGQNISLKTLQLSGNPFQCTCDGGLLDFILWIENSTINIPRLATSVTCQAQNGEKQHKSIIYFDKDDCDNIWALVLYTVSTVLILLTLLTSTTMHLFYWDASYVWYYISAKLWGYRTLQSSDTIYDAFISYDTKDPLVSDWVWNHLRVQLEEAGDKLTPICLEERDWTPGLPVLDNLTQSIYQSRKTVFVLTESYVRSGNFRMAVYLAHQRLLDDNVDVIVLLLLDPVLQQSHFMRLRRRLCQKSILEWSTNPSAEPWFWQRLRNAIHVDNKIMYNKVYARYFSDKAIGGKC